MKFPKITAILCGTIIAATAPALYAQNDTRNINIRESQRIAAALPINNRTLSRQASAQQVAAPARIKMPSPEALIIMIRSSLVALSHANMTNNYNVLNTLGSSNFRQANSAGRLSKTFASFRTNRIDLAPVVFVTPQLTAQPKIENGRLRLVGYFPTQPMRVNYDLQFEPSGGVWKLFGLAVNLNQVQPAPSARRNIEGVR